MFDMPSRRTIASDLFRKSLVLMRQILGGGAACIMLLGLVGCANSSSFAEHPKVGAEACGLMAQNGGVMLGADAVKDSHRATDYFRSDLPHNGVLPIYVVVENRAAKTFLEPCLPKHHGDDCGIRVMQEARSRPGAPYPRNLPKSTTFNVTAGPRVGR